MVVSFGRMVGSLGLIAAQFALLAMMLVVVAFSLLSANFDIQLSRKGIRGTPLRWLRDLLPLLVVPGVLLMLRSNSYREDPVGVCLFGVAALIGAGRLGPGAPRPKVDSGGGRGSPANKPER